MVGNSWYVNMLDTDHSILTEAARIHKAKYNDDTAKFTPSKDAKKARSRSRARTMFGLKQRSVD